MEVDPARYNIVGKLVIYYVKRFFSVWRTQFSIPSDIIQMIGYFGRKKENSTTCIMTFDVSNRISDTLRNFSILC